ncbi:peptidyl-tRNA hydrolase [Thiospirochaeta perfilievii]|uniref:Peptidyl-tRNA hydrolase n=1 Tax=Thiospirochaeta perfilievii TaxID=252967 RepID=A0A5C1Q7I7_9SPIO|nr:peptidyl-tRNA hydrolase [Thiospirochaeta perfilievii]
MRGVCCKGDLFFKINIDEVLVVHDDLETEFGSIKIKHGGGLAGHNGLRSIKDLTGSSNFKRLAIGISRPSRGSVANYVLERFTPQEESELDIIFKETENYFTKFLGDDDETKGKKVVILQQGREKR